MYKSISDICDDRCLIFITQKQITKGGPLMLKQTKQALYDELSTALTNYENHTSNETDLYEMLVKIQNN